MQLRFSVTHNIPKKTPSHIDQTKIGDHVRLIHGFGPFETIMVKCDDEVNRVYIAGVFGYGGVRLELRGKPLVMQHILNERMLGFP